MFDQFSEYAVEFGSNPKSKELESISINSLNYNSSNVWMMAKIMNPKDPMFRLDISLEYVEDFPMGGFAKFAIVFSVILVLAFIALGVTIYLNREGHIDIYVPTKLRPYCVKD